MALRIRPTTMRQHSDDLSALFPPELWLEIIPNLSLKEIRAFSECSKALRNILLPVLFETITIHPPRLSATYPSNNAATARDIQPFRIPYHITQVIENVAILPSGTTLQNFRQFPFREWINGSWDHDRLVPEIFNELLLLPKLCRLVCDRVILSGALLGKVVQLPLKHLEFSDCIPFYSFPTTTRVSGTLESVKIYFPPEIPWWKEGRESLYRVLLRESPNLKCMHIEDDFLFPRMANDYPPSLTSLNIPIDYLRLRSVLMTCVSLKSISLRPCYLVGNVNYGIPHGALPNLERYGGPVDLFPSFAQNRPPIKEAYLIFPSTLDPSPTLILSMPNCIKSVTCNFPSLDPFFALLHPKLASKSLINFTILSSDRALPQLFRSSNFVPLPNIRHFTLKAVYVAQSDSRSDLERILEDCFSVLLEVYPNLEEVRIIPSDDDGAWRCATVWRRSPVLFGWSKSRASGKIDEWWKA
ncbi:hypothetical protein BDN72DRAFT_959857 [Pluteus cervinus]|uniref:Uncharacterized protein n=1 Tax=Pluteus cervinus TaxID=181527 RepID=A0ACD3AT67_9AGAR|nr:hypothetical protein BDN72DRAFT_959857 [Pluteus cervinus]